MNGKSVDEFIEYIEWLSDMISNLDLDSDSYETDIQYIQSEMYKKELEFRRYYPEEYRKWFMDRL